MRKILILVLGLFLFGGYLSQVLSGRKFSGRAAQIISPGYSFCHRCKMPWKFTKGHTTPYGKEITQMIKAGESVPLFYGGCFPLCERCWQELESGENRLQYYRELWVEWQQWEPINHEKWEHIKVSVLAGN